MNIPEHIILTIRSKYTRPAKLSDPGSDFSQEERMAIISKSDADLTDTDLICIFQSYLPAGEYCESIYFLPIALERICNDDGDGAVTICDNLLRWIGQQKEKLEADGIYDELLSFFDHTFAELTSTFILAGNYPENCNRAISIFEALNAISPAMALGDQLLQRHLGKLETYEQAAWQVFFLEHHLYVYHESAYLQGLVDNKTWQQKAYDNIIAVALNDDGLLSFWNKHLNSCGIW